MAKLFPKAMQVQTGSRTEKLINSPFTTTAEILAHSLPNCHHQFDKLTSVFYAPALLLIMNFVITLSKPGRSADYFDNAMTNSFSITKQMHKKLTSNCSLRQQIVKLSSLALLT